MKNTLRNASLLAALTALPIGFNPQTAAAAPVEISVQADQPGAKINPAMWGVFFEDINFGADGGLYAELVKNRAFEFPDALTGWMKISPTMAKGEFAIREAEPFNAANRHYLRLRSEGTAPLGVSNEGYRGIGVHAGEAYDFSAQLRGVDGAATVVAELVSPDGTVQDSAHFTGLGNVWKKVTATLHAKETCAKARLNLMLEGKGTVDADMVSLFPQKTWLNRPGGLRADMVQMLADLKPGFVRFPGGCVVEGSHLDRRYQWKATIGPVEERQLLVNRWNYEFKHRPAPDYYQSFGLGFFEFFQMCADMGAEPLPILNCGMACQFNSNELVPVSQLDPYVQDALDLIEFANGPAASGWGAKRAAMGHPEPFNLKMLGVGNEQWGPQYVERYTVFAKAIHTKYPEIKLISSAGPAPADSRFEFLWPKLRELKADIVDEHCYANPAWFFSSADRYDKYDRKGPKVFMGEYAAQSVAIVSPRNRNNLECALSEAAFMTGLERNAEVVHMASYAPLFAHLEGWQWTPNLIWADNLSVYGTPNYYAQQLFSRNRGDVVLPTLNNAPVQASYLTGGAGVGTLNASAEFKDIRLTRAGQTLARGEQWPCPGGWTVQDGVLQQPNSGRSAVAVTGPSNGSDYTLELKARKLAGNGGLSFTFCDNGAGAYAAWNLEGGQATMLTHFAEQDQLLSQKAYTWDAAAWHDIKIALNGTHVEGYVDGQLVQSADLPVRRTPTLFTSAVREDGTGELILKVVNPGADLLTAKVNFKGLSSTKDTGTATVLTGGLADENSIEQPRKVAPVTLPLRNAGPAFDYTFAPRSMTVIRVGGK